MTPRSKVEEKKPPRLFRLVRQAGYRTHEDCGMKSDKVTQKQPGADVSQPGIAGDKSPASNPAHGASTGDSAIEQGCHTTFLCDSKAGEKSTAARLTSSVHRILVVFFAF